MCFVLLTRCNEKLGWKPSQEETPCGSLLFAGGHSARELRLGGLFVLACDMYRGHFKTLWYWESQKMPFVPQSLWTCAFAFSSVSLLRWGSFISMLPWWGNLCSLLYLFFSYRCTALCVHQTLLPFLSLLSFIRKLISERNVMQLINTSSPW